MDILDDANQLKGPIMQQHMDLFEKMLDGFHAQWSQVEGVSALIVYGSFITGRIGKYSDLDVMVVKQDDYPLESFIHLKDGLLLNISVIGLGEFRRNLNIGCLCKLRRILARHRILYDKDGIVTELMKSAVPRTRFEVSRYALTLLFEFLLNHGRAENCLKLGDTLDSMRYLFIACELAIMFALLDDGHPFDRDVFSAGLKVRPDLVTKIQDYVGNTTYDLALAAELLELLTEEREALLTKYRDTLMDYFPQHSATLSELKNKAVFSETGFLLFQAYVERGDLKKIGISREVPGFTDISLNEVGFQRA